LLIVHPLCVQHIVVLELPLPSTVVPTEKINALNSFSVLK
jgi:hypothetical protein